MKIRGGNKLYLNTIVIKDTDRKYCYLQFITNTNHKLTWESFKNGYNKIYESGEIPFNDLYTIKGLYDMQYVYSIYVIKDYLYPITKFDLNVVPKGIDMANINVSFEHIIKPIDFSI